MGVASKLSLAVLPCVVLARDYCPTGALEFEGAKRVGHVEDVSSCIKPDGTKAPCVPGNQMCPPGPFGKNTPQFHVRDLSCGENDPNGPVYDPVHGVYHLHYQNHVGCRGGRTYGHAVSRDLTKWAHMPVSIWNDRDYDEQAIYTGSATVVDGKVVQVYPGLCNAGSSDNCPGGTNLCIAIPADPKDPLQTNWTKEVFAVNPIVNNTGRDPSTAWKTPDGEWRLTTYDTEIMGSMDFKTWYRIGKQTAFTGGECPSFFPLPRNTPGAGAAPAGSPKLTHVHKCSHGGKDWMRVGSYVDGAPKVIGNWTTFATLPEVRIDASALYASKDFYDPVKGRRINWGWARVPPSSTQTLPREVTWHPTLQQLVYSPIEEQDALRTKVIGSLPKGTKLAATTPVALNLPAQAGNQSEIRVSFQRPSETARLSVNVMVDSSKGKKGTEFFVAYVAGTNKVSVGSGGSTDTLALLPGDKTIDLTLYVDNTFTEAFWMGGRVAMTIVTQSSGGHDDVTIAADQNGVVLDSVSAWSVGAIWTTPEEVTATPRRD